MTGRARGRARGRGSQQQQQPAAPAQQPRAAPPPSSGGAPGRGRSRGQQQQQQQPGAPRPQSAAPAAQVPPRQAAPQAAAPAQPPNVQQVASQMQGMQIQPQQQGQQERQQKRGLVKVGDADPDSCTTQAGAGGGCGTAGASVKIVSNYFKLSTVLNSTVNQYNVSFEPDIQSAKLKSALVGGLRDDPKHGSMFQARCFDGMTLFLPHKLPEKVMIFNVVTRREEAIKIKITFTNEVPPNSPSIVQLLNIQFRRQLKHVGMQLVGRNYYNPEQKIDINAHKMTVWPGFQTSILQWEKNVMLCADVSHKVLRQQTVLEALYELHNSLKNQKKENSFHAEATKRFVGEIVLTRYNNKTYRIDDINWEANPKAEFQMRDETISYADYIKRRYDREVKDLSQPLLISKPKAKDLKRGVTGNILLLPEFCAITGLSDELRANFTVMKDLAQHTRVAPVQRVKTLETFMQTMHDNQDAKRELQQWNMEFEKKLIRIPGRTLDPEQMMQKNCKFSYKHEEADWTRETRGKELIRAVSLQKWLLCYTQRDQKAAQDFFMTLSKVCPPMGMNVANPTHVKLGSDDARTYAQTLKAAILGTPDAQIAVCIVGNNKKDRYDAIKKICCLENPIPSQVIVSRTLSKQQMLMSVCTKVGIQLNCKLGGEIWATNIPLKNAMVIGMDVYHDSMSKGKSYCGFVASTNAAFTRYYSTIIEQRSHQELTDAVAINFTASLKKYMEINGRLPDHIIFFRDGVGDGQLEQVMNSEVRALKEAYPKLQDGYNPTLAFIIVKKRIGQRLFLDQGNNQFGNPKPGTIVDTEITRPGWYDFYLVSQAVRQGTVSPTHFHVVYNTTKFTPDHFQKLSYKLCHLYYNWPGTIRVPAPCQYAHKLAFLVGESLHAQPNSVLEDRLYYL